MNASSTAILQAGINGVTKLFIDLIGFAMTNWIPVVISIVVVVAVIGFLYGKASGLFSGHGKK
jgi:hypothetical protein